MSRIPKIDKKPKLNKDRKFIWVDSQWEKFMEEQKILKEKMLSLEMENAELRDRLIEMGENPNQMELF